MRRGGRPTTPGGAGADVVVAGAGPAGLAAAAELAERGLAVRLVAPSLEATWDATYAAWREDLPDDVPCAVVAPTVQVRTDHGERTARRPYVLVDAPGLQARLRARAEAAGARLQRGTVRATSPDGRTAVLGDGEQVRGRLVVDATGGAAALVRRQGAGARATTHQTAYGLLGVVDGAPDDLLMDWTDAHRRADDGVAGPTFLYAFGLGDGRVLLEETVLAGRPAAPPAALERVLRARLDVLGLRPDPDAAVERVRIPLDLAVPEPQPVVAVGVAGAGVHPATGYSVAGSLRAAPVLADAVAGALHAGEDPSAAAWAALWPREARAARALHAFGLQALLGLDGAGTQRFFDDFFRLPADDQAVYLSGGAAPGATAAVMARLFGRAAGPVRAHLLRTATSRAGRDALPALLRAARG